MRRLSVTEYLIAQNQAQTTVTTYAHIGDAINAVVAASSVPYDPEGGEPVDITPIYDYESYEGEYPEGATDEHRKAVYAIDCYATLGYVVAWRIGQHITYTTVTTF